MFLGSRTKWRSGVGMDDGAGLPADLPKLDFFFCSVVLLFMFPLSLLLLLVVLFLCNDYFLLHCFLSITGLIYYIMHF